MTKDRLVVSIFIISIITAVVSLFALWDSVQNGEPEQDNWVVFEHQDPDFAVRYPTLVMVDAVKYVDLVNDTADIGDAVGHKDRMLSIDVLSSDDVMLSSGGCWVDPASSYMLPEEQVNINNREYCKTVVREGALGSTYATYTYTTPVQDKYVAMLFTIRYPSDVSNYVQCGTEEQRETRECQELAFDEARDTALFEEILETFEGEK